MNPLLLTAGKWLAGDAVRIRSRRVLFAVLLATSAEFGWGIAQTWSTMRPAVQSKPPPPLPPDRGDERFGLPLSTRKQIFAQFAAAEPGYRAEGHRAFNGPGLEWSAEDHRGAFERQKAAALSSRFHVSLTQVYMCLDEGIREHWPGPDGKPLDPHTVPLNPRRKYGW